MQEEIKIRQRSSGDLVGTFEDLTGHPYGIVTVASEEHKTLYLHSGNQTTRGPRGMALDRRLACMVWRILGRFHVSGTIEELGPDHQLDNLKEELSAFDRQERKRFEPVRARLLQIDGWAKFIIERAGNEANAAAAQNIREVLQETFIELDEAIG